MGVMRTTEEYLALPYTKIVRWNADDQLFVATVKEIKGCTAHGDTEAEALEMLRNNLAEWISFSIENGDEIPEPSEDDLPSGKWLQRVPRSLHSQLVELAEQDATSLNQFVTSVLSIEVGRRMNGPHAGEVQISSQAETGHERWGKTLKQVVRWHVTRTMAHPYVNIEDEYVRHLIAATPNKISRSERVGGLPHVEGRKVWEN
jgi:antitoxin HicB